MKKEVKGFFLGVLICVILSMSGVALAVGRTVDLKNVTVGGVRIVVDGKELHPTDSDGNAVDPIIYNGTIYLPVQAISTAIGKAAYWDGPNYTVYLGNMEGMLENPSIMTKNMNNIGAHGPVSTDKLVDNYDNSYGSALIPQYKNIVSEFEYLLNMKYSRLRCTLYIPKGATNTGTQVITISADGNVLFTSPPMTKSSRPEYVDINVAGYNDLRISYSNYYSRMPVNIGDAGFYQ